MGCNNSHEFHYYAPVDNELVAVIFSEGVYIKEGALGLLKFFRVKYNWAVRPVSEGFAIEFACESEERAWELCEYFKRDGSHAYTYLDPEELTFNEKGPPVARTLQHSGGDSSGALQVSSGGVEGVDKVPAD